MVVEERSLNYRLNHVTLLDLSVVTASLRVVVTAPLRLAREETVVERERCLKVIGLVQVVETPSPSYRFSQGIPRTSSVWTASSRVAKMGALRRYLLQSSFHRTIRVRLGPGFVRA